MTRSRDGRRILWLLAAATLIPIGILSWLGARILEQDRSVERQRRREAVELAAGRLALDIDSRLQEIEEALSRGEGVALTRAGLSPADVPLLYQPSGSPPIGSTSAAFEAGEREEFQRGNFAAAATAYRRIGRDAAPHVRAEALLRLGRVLRKAGDYEAAVRTYGELESFGNLLVAHQPAVLVAHQGRCRAYEEARDAEGLQKEAAALARLLQSGGWPIDRPTFELYRDLVQRWGAAAPDPVAVARTDAAIHLWESWRDGGLPPRGRRVLREGPHAVLAIWTAGPEHPVAWFATDEELEATFGPLWTPQALIVAASGVGTALGA